MNESEITLIGAGLTGCLLALLLGRRGIGVTVYERRPDPRLGTTERDRSINLALSARGFAALEEVGLANLMRDISLPMVGRMVHPEQGEAGLQYYGADPSLAIHSISRNELNVKLLEAAAATPGVKFIFDHRLTAIDLEAGTVEFATPDGAEIISSETVLAADGAFSATRTALEATGRLHYEIDELGHGYKELTIPALNGEYAIAPDALHIWARGDSMMIALPNLDKSFTCTLFWPKSGPRGFDQLTSEQEILNFFERHYADAVPLMPDLVSDYQNNPIGALTTVKTWPWSAQGAKLTVGLVGDAAHAIVPFYAQGANCGFEDAVEIFHLVDEIGTDWPQILRRYQENRKANTDAIAQLSLQNFIEMRDSVNSPLFRAKNAVLHGLSRFTSGLVKTEYEMVSFTTIPYSHIGNVLRKQGLKIGVFVVGALVGGLSLRRVLRR